MRPLLAFVAALVLSASASAQPSRQASAESSLAAAATPASVDIRAGGPDRNAVSGSGCSGFIRNARPVATVAHSGGPLSIYVTSGTDTTLLVADPAGRWQCSDDANGSNPAVTFAAGQSGEYTVWVGTFSAEAADAAATLFAVQGQPSW